MHKVRHAHTLQIINLFRKCESPTFCIREHPSTLSSAFFFFLSIGAKVEEGKKIPLMLEHGFDFEASRNRNMGYSYIYRANLLTLSLSYIILCPLSYESSCFMVIIITPNSSHQNWNNNMDYSSMLQDLFNYTWIVSFECESTEI